MFAGPELRLQDVHLAGKIAGERLGLCNQIGVEGRVDRYSLRVWIVDSGQVSFRVDHAHGVRIPDTVKVAYYPTPRHQVPARKLTHSGVPKTPHPQQALGTRT